MKQRTIAIILICVIGVVLYSCAKKPAADSKVLATVSNRFITLSDLKYRFSKIPAYYQNIVDKNKKRFLDELIIEMMFYEEAMRKGLNRDKEVREVVAEARKKILIAKLIKEEVEDKVEVSEEEAKEFYESHKDNFKTAQLWRVSHILVPTEKEATDLLEALAKGESFEDLARVHSTDATASRGGDVGYFKEGQLVPDFEKACFKLKVGETSGIIHTQFGYHIIKLTDIKEPEPEPFEKARRAIEDELKRKKRSELFDKLVLNLKEKYHVKIEEDVFDSLENLTAKGSETK